MISGLRDRPYFLLSLTSLFWAGNAVVGRAIVDVIPPVALATIRWSLAFLILLPFVWTTLQAEASTIRRNLGILALLAATSVGAFNTLLYWSLLHTTAINATLMQSAGPLLIGLWSLALFSEPLTRGQLGGIFLSLVGIAVIVSGGDPVRLASLSLNIGDVAVLLAIGIYGLYSTLLRKRPAMTAPSFAAVTIGMGALMLMPVAFAEYLSGARITPLTPGAIAAIGYVTVFPSILAVLCYNRGVQLIGANRSGPFLHLVPLFGAILAVIFLGERPGWHHAVGAILVVGGVFVASASRREASKNRVAAPAEHNSTTGMATTELRLDRVGWTLLLALALLWSISFIFIKVAGAEIPVFTLVLVRVGLAALVLHVFVLATRRSYPSDAKTFLNYAVMGVLNNLLPFVLIVHATANLGAGAASILNATSPIFALIVAHLATADEKITPAKLAGILLGVGGVAAMVGPEALSGLGENVTAAAAMLLASFFYGVSAVFGRRFRGIDATVSATCQLTASTLILLPVALVIERPWSAALPGATALASAIALAIFSTSVAYVLYYALIRRAGATNTVLVTLLIPVGGVFFAWLMLGEAFTASEAIGLLFIGLGLLVIDGRVIARLRRAIVPVEEAG